MKRALIFLVLSCLAVIATPVRAQDAELSEREAMYYRYLEFPSYVKGGSIEPHWMADGSSFWYAEGAPANTVIWKVDPVANTKTPLFDTARLRQALTEVLGHAPPYQGLPFSEFTFSNDSETTIRFTVDGKEFILELNTYRITQTPILSKEEENGRVPQIARKGVGYPDLDLMEILSPDGRWFATLKAHNLWIRSAVDGHVEQLTSGGIEDYEWRDAPVRTYSKWCLWSPDSLKLAAKKVDYRKVPKMPIVRYLKETEEVQWIHFPKAGDPIPQTELFIIDIVSKRKVHVKVGAEPDHYILLVGWRSDGTELLFYRVDRYWQELDLMAANPMTGTTRVLLTEAHPRFARGRGERYFTWLPDGNRFLWMSERDGWDHLYLYDMNGKLIRRLTRGTLPVVEVVAVDDEADLVYFTAQGDQTRPYDIHLYRVSLNGESLAQLTEATGQHEIHFAPSKQFFLDTHSTVARPPTVELRQADGTVLQVLSKTNIDTIISELKWKPPEEFVVKAADGKTDLYGVLYKPYDFDPNKKYPVIETIYGGLSVVPRNFTGPHFGTVTHARAQLGFITLIVDNRGTDKRGQEFRKVRRGQMGRYEIPDHVAALRQLAESRPYMDLSGVGIVGGSHGGYMTIRAMLQAPDVYHVGVAIAPLSDLAEHWALEAHMGPPKSNKEGYEYASNLHLAANLKGKLLLIHGVSDTNVPFSHTIRMVEALVRTSKPYDLILLPRQGHDIPEPHVVRYVREAIGRYFQDHLKP